MKIIKPSIEILDILDEKAILKRLELAGRTCYKSENKITDTTCVEFVQKIIRSGHHSILEHVSISVRVICDRGVTHEIVRHRIASYAQESTRYCNYSDDKFGNQITVIKPSFWNSDKPADIIKRNIWEQTMAFLEDAYMKLLLYDATPQEARSILPNSLKTEIVMTMNIREWRHFLTLRTSQAAHPQMREIAGMILFDFAAHLPVIFGDIKTI